MHCLSSCDWLVSFSIKSSWFIHIVEWQDSLLFKGSIILRCAYIQHFLYSLIHRCTLRWFSPLAYGESCCNELGDVGNSAILPSIVLDAVPQAGRLDHMVGLLFNFFLRNLLAVSHRSCANLHPHQEGIRVSSSISLSALLFIYNSHPSRNEVISHCGLDLHFHDNQ